MIYEHLLKEARKAQKHVVLAESCLRGASSLRWSHGRDRFENPYLYLGQICTQIRTELWHMVQALNDPSVYQSWGHLELADLASHGAVVSHSPDFNVDVPTGRFLIVVDVDQRVDIREFLLSYSTKCMKGVTIRFPTYHPKNVVRYLDTSASGWAHNSYQHERCHETSQGLDDWLDNSYHAKDPRWHDYLRRCVSRVEPSVQRCRRTQCEWQWIDKLTVLIKPEHAEYWMGHARLSRSKKYERYYDWWGMEYVWKWRGDIGVPKHVAIFPFVAA